MEYMSEEELAIAQQQFIHDYNFRMYKRTAMSIIISCVMFIVSLVLIFGLCLDTKKVYGTGMEPTIAEDSFVFINKLAFSLRSPLRGDVVVTDRGIGRIVGLPGEKVTLYGGHVYIDDKFVEEEYLIPETLTYPYHGQDTFELSADEFFVLTDGRYSFADSRSMGPVNKDDIIGRIIAAIRIGGNQSS